MARRCTSSTRRPWSPTRETRARCEDRPKFYGDDHLWIVLAVCAYLKETGDLAFLDKSLPYYDKDKPASARRARHRARPPEARGRVHQEERGRPRPAAARLCRLERHRQPEARAPSRCSSPTNTARRLLELIELCRFRGDARRRIEYQSGLRAHARRGQRVRLGRRVVRALLRSRRQRHRLASKNAQGKIWTNGQSWPVISGFAPPIAPSRRSSR